MEIIGELFQMVNALHYYYDYDLYNKNFLYYYINMVKSISILIISCENNEKTSLFSIIPTIFGF